MRSKSLLMHYLAATWFGLAVIFALAAGGAELRDTLPDTWVATDALGRKLPTAREVGPPRPHRTVGMFYFLWHGAHIQGGPYEVTRILSRDPEAMQKPDSPLWGPLHGFNVGEQWERALAEDPRFIFVTGWNEWIAGRFNKFGGIRLPVMFVDQFDQEHSRDIEPMSFTPRRAWQTKLASASSHPPPLPSDSWDDNRR
jgi:hypothetical protein